MAAMTNYAKNKVIDALLRGVTLTPPSALYLALFTATPTAVGGGTEVSGNAYARVNLAPSTTNWSATNGATTTTNPSSGTSGTSSNNVAINFTTATPGAWGTLTGFAIFDASTSGNMWFYGALSSSEVVNAGGTFSWPISQLAYQVDN